MSEPKRRGRKPANPVADPYIGASGSESKITDEQVIELTLSKGLSIERAHYLVESSKDDRDKDWNWFVAKYIGG